MLGLSISVAVIAALLFPYYSSGAKPTAPVCRCRPGEPCWPGADEWDAFNASISGNLVRVKPLGYVCHDPTFDEDACNEIKSHASNASWRIEQPGALQTYNLENWMEKNETCYLNVNKSEPCSQGRVSLYSAIVTSVEQTQETVKFAKKNNLRVAVRNTGHDFSGKSSTPNSLQIHTAQFKGIQYFDNFIPDSDGARKSEGPAVVVGAGVLTGELYNAAAEGGYTVVAGACSTVGVAGGFIQGGGASILSPLRGLASDNALQFEVVTAEGSLVIANLYQNPDLFWALRGGGGGTYGVVTSVAMRAYPEIPVTISKLNFKSKVENTSFWDAVEEQCSALPDLMEGGNSGEISLSRMPVTQTEGGLDISSAMTWYTMGVNDTTEVDKRFSSLREALDKIGISYAYSSQAIPKIGSFLSIPNALEVGGIGQLQGSAFISHDTLASSDGRAKMVEAFSKTQTNPGDAIIVNALAGGQVIANKDIDSAVHPYWRSTDLFVDFFRGIPPNSPVEVIQAEMNKLTNVQMPVLRTIESELIGSYLNIADPQQKDFQTMFWGHNYQKLYRLKKKWDKDALFIVKQGVGSEDWDEEGMCRIK